MERKSVSLVTMVMAAMLCGIVTGSDIYPDSIPAWYGPVLRFVNEDTPITGKFRIHHIFINTGERGELTSKKKEGPNGGGVLVLTYTQFEDGQERIAKQQETPLSEVETPSKDFLMHSEFARSVYSLLYGIKNDLIKKYKLERRRGSVRSIIKLRTELRGQVWYLEFQCKMKFSQGKSDSFPKEYALEENTPEEVVKIISVFSKVILEKVTSAFKTKVGPNWFLKIEKSFYFRTKSDAQGQPILYEAGCKIGLGKKKKILAKFNKVYTLDSTSNKKELRLDFKQNVCKLEI